MKTLYNILITTFFLVTYSSIAQNKFEGIVMGIDGPINGAKIISQESGIKTTTTPKGEFIIESKMEELTFIASYKKMTKTVHLHAGKNKITIHLIPEDKRLYKWILEKNEIRLCDIYMDNYPEGIFMKQVIQLKEKLFFIEAYNIAASQFTDTALQNYLKLYPNGTYKEKAADAIEIAAWQKAKYENTPNSYNEYLQHYPNGKASNLAKEKIAVLNH